MNIIKLIQKVYSINFLSVTSSSTTLLIARMIRVEENKSTFTFYNYIKTTKRLYQHQLNTPPININVNRSSQL